MREEFHQPNEFHMASEFSQEESAQEFHAPSVEYHALSQEYYAPSEEYHASSEYHEPQREGVSGQLEPIKPPKASLVKKMRKMLYVASATVFVTAATQAVYPDFVVFSDPFSTGQEWEGSLELPSQEDPAPLSPSEKDASSKPTDPKPPSSGSFASEESVESSEFSDSPESSEEWIDCPNCEDGFVVCPVCNGDWEHAAEEAVEIDCEHCENGTHLKSQTIYVYNGTPCKFCNDVGTFVDANGETVECGECRGYASRHQVGEKQIFEYYNEFYRVYAFDESVEYVEEDCPVCGGRGVISETVEVLCTECSEGSVECPVCQGEAGYYE